MMKWFRHILPLLVGGSVCAEQWEAYPSFGEWTLSEDGNSVSRPFLWNSPDLPCGQVALTLTATISEDRQADYSFRLTDAPEYFGPLIPGFKRVALTNDSGSFPQTQSIPSGNPLGKTVDLDVFEIAFTFDKPDGPCEGVSWVDGGDWMFPRAGGAANYVGIWASELDGIDGGALSGAVTSISLAWPGLERGTPTDFSVECTVVQWTNDPTPDTIDWIPVFDVTYDSGRAEVWRASRDGGDSSIVYWPTFGRVQVDETTALNRVEPKSPSPSFTPAPEWEMPLDNPWWISESWGWLYPAWRHNMEDEGTFAGSSPGRDWVYSDEFGWLWGGGSDFAWSVDRENWIYASKEFPGWFYFVDSGSWEYVR